MAADAGRFAEVTLFTDVASVVAAYPNAEVIAVDMPMGLPETGRRLADVEAKGRLGKRSATVFFTPPRDVVEAPTYEAANALARSRHGFGISKQSYALRPKILEVDAVVRAGSPMFEVHPDLAFHDLAKGEVPSKRSYRGLKMREALLRRVGMVVPDDLGAAGIAPMDDILDAAVVAIVAGRISRGEATSLPLEAEHDQFGIPMVMWV